MPEIVAGASIKVTTISLRARLARLAEMAGDGV
jgi:hypothetical protein